MRPILILLYVLTTSVLCFENRIVDFVSKLLLKNTNNVVYVVLDCDPQNHENAIAIFDNVGKYFPTLQANIITIPLSANVSRPSIFTRNIKQFEESLRYYVCAATITYKGFSESFHDSSAVTIMQTAEQTRRDDVFLVISGRTYDLSTNSLISIFKNRGVQMNIIWTAGSREPEPYAYIVGQTGGQIFAHSQRKSFEENERRSYDITTTKENGDYEVKVSKKSLQMDARNTFELQARTFKIFLTLYGDVRKALFISPTGIVINLIPENVQYDTKIGQNGATPANSEIFFVTPIAESPATWTLSANGGHYDATMISFVAKTRNNGFTQRRDYDIGNDAFDIKEQFRSNIQNTTQAKTYNDAQEFAKREDNEDFVSFVPGQSRVGDLRNDFLVKPLTNSIPTIIDVDPLSTFYVFPGEEAQIIFNVRNNKLTPSHYNFNCFYQQQPCFVHPTHEYLVPQQRVQVIVKARAEGSDGSSNILSLVSHSVDFVDKKAYLFIGKQKADNNRPNIEYEYNGNCDDANTGTTCKHKTWSANLIAQDTESGLLNFWSEPPGLIYTTEFVAGTRDQITARYTASCCDPKVDISATDLRGNSYKITLDVEHQHLSFIEITAIVLGVILLIVVVTNIVYFVIRWRKKKNERDFLNG